MSVTAVVLAGSRSGRPDPLAERAGVPFKCLVPVAGRPLIEHVLVALAGSARVGDIRIVINGGAVHAPLFAHLPCAARLRVVDAKGNLADSVLAAAEGAHCPLLVTTADNVHLTSASTDAFIAGCEREGAAAALGFARREAVLAVHPEGQRKFYRFSDGAFSNCNIYWIGEVGALSAAEMFRSGGQFVKYPARIAETFGILNLVRFRFGIGSVHGIFRRISRRFGYKVAMVELADGAMAIDVDNERSHGVAEAILTRRMAGAPVAAAQC